MPGITCTHFDRYPFIHISDWNDCVVKSFVSVLASTLTEVAKKYVNEAYPGEFLKGMMTQRQNKQFTDVELEAGDVNIPCHKVVLAAASPYFNTMFTSGLQESTSRTVPLEVDSATLACVVDYFYTAEVEFTVDNVQKIVEASDLLQVDDLKTAGEKFMLERVDAANCVGFHNFASLYRLKQLQEGARQVMLDKFRSVVSDAEFKDLTCAELIDYISEDGINAKDEDLVFESVLVWVRHDTDNRTTCLRKILDDIRLPFCTINYLHHVVDTCDLFTSECREYVREAIKYQNQAATRHDVSSCRMGARTHFCVNQRLLVVGGINEVENERVHHKCCHQLSEDGNSWTRLTELPRSVEMYNSVCRVGGGLLLTGGLQSYARDDCWIFELAKQKWEKMPPLNTARCWHSNVVLGDTVYVLGGMDATRNTLTSVECLDVKRRQWSTAPDMPESLHLLMATSFGNGVYVFGGRGAKENALRCSRVYDTTWGVWRTLANMPQACDLGSVVTLNSHLYVVGGYTQSCLRYDPSVDDWTVLSQPRMEHGIAPAVVWRGRILVAGGMGSDGSTIEEYDPETDQWSNWDTKLKVSLSSHFLFNIDFYGII